jgi:hypothetical protein
MKNKIFCIVLVFSFGCNGYQYVSNPTFIPLHEKKGETKILIGGKSLHAAHSFSDHLGYFASGNFGFRQGNNLNGLNDIKKDNSLLLNFGMNYFVHFNPVYIEIQGAAGGGTENYNHSIDRNITYDYTLTGYKFNSYIQPIIAVKLAENIRFGVFAKFVGLKYFDLKTSLNSNTSNSLDKYPQDEFFAGRNYADLFFF